MKKALKVLGLLVATAAIALGGLVGWLSARNAAQRPAPDVKIAATPERIARGRYLAEHVTNCIDCHSDHALTYGIPVKPGTEGQGGFIFDIGAGVPGVIAARNLTPDPETGKGRWTDGEILRAMREGVDRDGAALFPIMPYEWFRQMSDDDAQAIVAYLRTLKPIRHQIPQRRIDFPASLFVKLVPQPLGGPVSAPDAARDPLGYGRYLAVIAGCIECHTPKDDRHQRIAAQELGGGFEFKGPWGTVVSANITPHAANYMGQASKAEFIGRFKAWLTIDPNQAPPKGRNTVMPWRAFAGMSEGDLGSIYDYLRSVKPIDKRVNPFPEG